MKVSMEEGRLILAPTDESEAAELAEWHSRFTQSSKAEVCFKSVEERKAGTALVLTA